MNLKEAKSLAVKVLTKTMDGTTLSSEKCNHFFPDTTLVEFATISLGADGKVLFTPFSDEEIDTMLQEEAIANPVAPTPAP